MNTSSTTPGPRYFERNKLMSKARNPKPEIRKKSEGRSPKGASSATPAAAPARRTHAAVSRSRPRPPQHADRDRCPLWRYCGGWTGSDFGFRASFGFRVSAFGFPSCPIPLKTASIIMDLKPSNRDPLCKRHVVGSSNRPSVVPSV